MCDHLLEVSRESPVGSHCEHHSPQYLMYQLSNRELLTRHLSDYHRSWLCARSSASLHERVEVRSVPGQARTKQQVAAEVMGSIIRLNKERIRANSAYLRPHDLTTQQVWLLAELPK